MYEITIIEDNYALNNGIALALKNYDYNITQIYKLKEFDKNRKTDLIILDINLPDGNGFDFLKHLRTYSDVSVIILTANDLETDEVMGLELGADDYITIMSSFESVGSNFVFRYSANRSAVVPP